MEINFGLHSILKEFENTNCAYTNESDCMVFNAVYNIISLILRRPVNLFAPFWSRNRNKFYLTKVYLIMQLRDRLCTPWTSFIQL